jgi:parallel beta-helix repeat protein
MKKLLLVIVIGLSRFSAATIINIPADYSTIQQGIYASNNGDTVLVQPGIYYENINFNGHNIVLGSLFLTTGDTSYIEQTVIDGDSAGTVVTFENNEDSTAILIGFTIRGGTAYCPDIGGGIFCTNSSPRIIGNIITENLSWCHWPFAAGGGIYCGQNSNPIIFKNKITGNTLIDFNQPSFAFGAGIACDSSSPQIVENYIVNNSILYADEQYGGGIACRNQSNPICKNNVISRNEASSGAGMYVYASNPIIEGNTIVGNIGWYGGGIYVASDTIAITNTIIWGNTGPEDAEIRNRSTNLEVTYCDVRGGWEGEGNIDVDPRFIDPLSGNYNVFLGSPCIDAGDPDIIDPNGTRSDIGVYFEDHPFYSSNIWYVSITGNDTTGDGTLVNPFRTIQHGVNMSASGDTVIVLNGTYLENVIIYYKSIVLASNYILSGDTLDIFNTIIDGDSISSAVRLDLCDSSTLLTGFTIRNGVNEYGGGIHLLNSDPLIYKNIITENYVVDNSSARGGGIYCWLSNPVIKNNIISFNQASAVGASGGGIYIAASNPSIVYNEISHNSASGSGGGIYCSSTPYTLISNNSIIGNLSGQGGGIACAWQTDSTVIRNNRIMGNMANYSGGGIYLGSTSPPLINNLVTKNSAPEGGGIRCYYSSPTIVNCILWADSASSGPEISFGSGCNPAVSYSDIEGGWPGDGNIDINPLFRDPDNGDLHLMSIACGDSADSPCIDTGDPNILDSLLDCSWGLGGTRSDMGAYGGGDSVEVGIPGNPTPLPRHYILYQNYPNPFNASTTIEFTLPKESHVELSVYNILGQKVATLFEGQKTAGKHSVTWDAGVAPSGVYFARLKSRGNCKTMKMLLLK